MEDDRKQKILEAHERRMENQRKKREEEKNKKISTIINNLIELGYEPLKDYENEYYINREGKVWSLQYNKEMKLRICKGSRTNGYLGLGLLSKELKHIHRLLAIQYIPNPENLEEVDHIDMNKLNNNLDNLRWVSRSTNCKNRDRSYKTQGSIFKWCNKNTGKYYWKAQYYVDYNTPKTKNSIDRSVCEEWLENMIKQYPRDNKI